MQSQTIEIFNSQTIEIFNQILLHRLTMLLVGHGLYQVLVPFSVWQTPFYCPLDDLYHALVQNHFREPIHQLIWAMVREHVSSIRSGNEKIVRRLERKFIHQVKYVETTLSSLAAAGWRPRFFSATSPSGIMAIKVKKKNYSKSIYCLNVIWNNSSFFFLKRK